MLLTLLPLASYLAVQTGPFVAATSVGAVRAAVSPPNTSGFTSPVLSRSRGGYAECVSGTVSVSASAQNLKISYDLPTNQTLITNLFVELVTDGSPVPASFIKGTQNISGTYDFGASLCLPANGTVSDTVHFLTHGVGFDRYYWDFAPGYSYVDYAAQQGYATFLYDRLGTGLSSTPDPVQVVQSPLQVAIAAELIRKLRNGAFGGLHPTHVVGVGHSYGSSITQGVTVQYPDLLDATVLTGFSTNATGQVTFAVGNNFAIASQHDPARFGNRSTGYIMTSSDIANQIAFFRAPAFDPTILSRAQASVAPTTVGELLTTTAVVARAANYTGLLALVNGEADLSFCYGNCTHPVDKTALVQQALYPHAKNVEGNVYNVPATGHGVNLHYTANDAYRFILTFLKNNGY